MTGVQQSFCELSDKALKVANRLKLQGIKYGDHVMVYSYNHETYIPIVVGIMSIGAIPCLANPAYTGENFYSNSIF